MKITKYERLRDIVFTLTFVPFVLPAFALIMVSAILYAAAVTLLYLFWLLYGCTFVTLFRRFLPYDIRDAWSEFDFSYEWSVTREVVSDLFYSLLELFKLS